MDKYISFGIYVILGDMFAFGNRFSGIDNPHVNGICLKRVVWYFEEGGVVL